MPASFTFKAYLERAMRSRVDPASPLQVGYGPVEVPQLGYSLKGMHKSAQGCAATHYPGKRSGPFVPSLKGMNTPGHLLSIPFREWKGYLAVPG